MQRPRTIPIVAAFLFAATGIAAVVGMSLLFPNRFLDQLGNRPGDGMDRWSLAISAQHRNRYGRDWPIASP